MVKTAQWLAGVGLVAASVALAPGCTYWPEQPKPGPAGWSAATALGRSADPVEAATEAAELARRRLGSAPARAVIFFECFAELSAAAAEKMVAALRAVFPEARMIGCSAAGVLAGAEAAANHAVALLAIGGQDLSVSSAYLPASPLSARYAGERLAGDLAGGYGQAAVILLADAALFRQSGWDPNELMGGLTDCWPGARPSPGETDSWGRPNRLAIFGGLAQDRGRPVGGSARDGTGAAGRQGPVDNRGGAARIYHADRVYPAGLAAMQISPVFWGADAAQELRPVGPVQQVGKAAGPVVSELTGADGAAPADQVILQLLNAQERQYGHVARIVGNRYVPLRFELPGDSTLRLPIALDAGERLAVMASSAAEARAHALGEALAGAEIIERYYGLPITLLALPAGPQARYADELGRMRQELNAAYPRHPLTIGFLGAGQVVPVADLAGRTSPQYSDHALAALQIGAAVGMAARPTTVLPAALQPVSTQSASTRPEPE